MIHVSSMYDSWPARPHVEHEHHRTRHRAGHPSRARRGAGGSQGRQPRRRPCRRTPGRAGRRAHGGLASDDTATAVQVWRIISHDGARPLVVRPSAAGPDRRRSGAGDRRHRGGHRRRRRRRPAVGDRRPRGPTTRPRRCSCSRTCRARGAACCSPTTSQRLAGSPAGRRRRSGVHRLPVGRRARPHRSGARPPVGRRRRPVPTPTSSRASLASPTGWPPPSTAPTTSSG